MSGATTMRGMSSLVQIAAMAIFAIAVSLTGCTKSSNENSAAVSSKDAAAESAEKLVSRGKVAYLTYCIACHNVNPALDGTVGPANAGASRELIEARLIRGEYPAGYTPKRTSKVMPLFPQLKNDIDAIAAYLGSAK